MKGNEKYEYLFDAKGTIGILNDYLPMLHSRGNPVDLVKRKIDIGNFGYNLDMTYGDVSYENEWYVGRGFVYSNETVDENYNYHSIVKIDAENPITKNERIYLNKIRELCQNNGIELILLDGWIPDATLTEMGGIVSM